MSSAIRRTLVKLTWPAWFPVVGGLGYCGLDDHWKATQKVTFELIFATFPLSLGAIVIWLSGAASGLGTAVRASLCRCYRLAGGSSFEKPSPNRTRVQSSREQIRGGAASFAICAKGARGNRAIGYRFPSRYSQLSTRNGPPLATNHSPLATSSLTRHPPSSTHSQISARPPRAASGKSAPASSVRARRGRASAPSPISNAAAGPPS